MRKQLLFLSSLLLAIPAAFSQSLPTNIDFETGTLSNWNFYTGTCCPISAGTATAPVSNRHTLTTGTGTDPYGGFPIVAPSSGSYSFKLGNDSGTAQSEHVRYYVHIPSGSGSYSLVMHYAIVMENPAHAAPDQPRWQISAFDSVTGSFVPCGNFTFVAASSLPAFLTSSVPAGGTGGAPDVIYRPWSMANINFNGLGGRTVALDFASGDCSLGGHFGYGYVDVSPGLFNTSKTIACGSMDTLSAPTGYSGYHWYDSATFSTSYGTSQTVVLSLPPTSPMTYAVILTPFAGYGCTDTLYTRVSVALPCPSLGVFSANAGNETATVGPNPATDELTVQLGAKWYDALTICSQVGTVVMEKSITNAETKLDLSRFAPGVYFITLKGPNGSDVRRFVKM